LYEVSGFSIARDGAFGSYEIFVDGRKARGSRDRLHIRILLVEAGYIFEGFPPRGFIDFQRDGGLDGDHGWSFREIVDGIGVGAELLERGLFFRKRLAGGFVSGIGGEPNLAAEGDGIVVERQNAGFALAAAEIAVLLVIADANDDAQNADVNVLIFADGAESRFRAEVVHFVDAILDVIGRLNLIHFQLGF